MCGANAPEAVTRLLLCVGDRDGAAASLVARLASPNQRADALNDLSDFDPSPPGMRPELEQQRLLPIRDRADVRAAIAAAGGTRRFNVQRVTF